MILFGKNGNLEGCTMEAVENRIGDIKLRLNQGIRAYRLS
jgi:hypothetical protein